MSVRILEGDCLSVMPTLEAESIDAIVCDPPYGLKFMGKEWDHGVPGVPFWDAARRVAKPGAYLLAFGGTRTHHRLACAIEDAGWEIRDCLMWLHGQGFPKGKAQLKPAWEPIIMARKKGQLQPLNIDGCRIGTEVITAHGGGVNHYGRKYGGGKGIPAIEAGSNPHSGRWPANLILDDTSAVLLDGQAVNAGGGGGGTVRAGVGVFKYGGENPRPQHSDAGGSTVRPGYADKGGASRFYFTAKASRSEREAGLEARNHHPTVKPLDLMQWLCRLVTPKGGLILDPFCGSGSTGRAAVAEGFRFIGIEKSPEYAAIARARIAEYAPLFGGVA